MKKSVVVAGYNRFRPSSYVRARGRTHTANGSLSPALKFRGPVVALCIRYISRRCDAGCTREKSRKRCARWHNIKSTAHLNINEPRVGQIRFVGPMNIFPSRASNSRSPGAQRRRPARRYNAEAYRATMYVTCTRYLHILIHTREKSIEATMANQERRKASPTHGGGSILRAYGRDAYICTGWCHGPVES